MTPIITINGHKFVLNSRPLEQYWDSGSPKPRLVPLYIAMSVPIYDSSWLIEDRKLYITSFCGSSSFGKPDYNLDTLFPDNKGKVFASWYTGKLSLSYGKDVGPFFVDFINYEHTVNCEFENGVVVSGLTIADVISIQPLK